MDPFVKYDMIFNGVAGCLQAVGAPLLNGRQEADGGGSERRPPERMRGDPQMSFYMLGGLLPIKPREAARDVLAGLTLASMNIPQVLGYTRIAGTPVITGLYTVLLPLALGLSIIVVAAILLGRRFAPRFPVPLVVVIGMIAASAWLHLAEDGLAVIGPVPGGLPSLRWPAVSWR